MVKVASWERFPWLRQGFTTRAGGATQVYGRPNDLNLGFTREDDPAIVRENRALAGLALTEDVEPFELRTVLQVHGTEVVIAGTEPVEADGMVTMQPGELLGIMVADCVPVLLADKRTRAVAALHAGWRGTAAGIVVVGVEKMRNEFGSRPEDLIAAIGPSIGPCCYQVGPEFRDYFSGDLFTEGKLNLWEANRRQLLAAGLREVAVLGECTACMRLAGERKYFSHRAEAGRTGRSMGLIGIAPD